MTSITKDAVAVERDVKGRIVKGALNGGGMTAEMRQARDALNQWLCAEPQVEKGKAAYLHALDEGNPIIIKDWMDRVAGKPREHLEVSGDISATVEHDVKAEVIQSVDRMRTIVAVLVKSGALELTETAAPVEAKEEA